MKTTEPDVMLWICRDCGMEVCSDDPVLITTIGWTGLDGDTGVCTICSSPQTSVRQHPRARASQDRIAQSSLAVAASRARIARAKHPGRDDARLDEAATRRRPARAVRSLRWPP